MPYYDAQGNAVDQATFNQQFNGGNTTGALGGLQYAMNAAYAQRGQQLGTAYAAADTTAERETADAVSAANAATAERTNSLAQQLASARNTPGGGIRRGLGRNKGLTAGSATPGLTAANAAEKLKRRKAELRAQVDEEFANKPNQNYTLTLGDPIQL